MSAGKGDKPRNCFSEQYRSNYDDIDWGKKSSTEDLIEKEKRIDRSMDRTLKELEDANQQ